jgi:hypothetical protein
MPVYMNNTDKTRTHNGKTWAPGDAFAVNFFVPDEVGLTMTDEAPRVRQPTLAAGTLSLSSGGTAAEIYAPMCAYFKASFVCEAGDAVIRESYRDSAVTIEITPAASFRGEYDRNAVERFFVDTAGGGVVSYVISRAE